MLCNPPVSAGDPLLYRGGVVTFPGVCHGVAGVSDPVFGDRLAQPSDLLELGRRDVANPGLPYVWAVS
jgi:hypothetical protein